MDGQKSVRETIRWMFSYRGSGTADARTQPGAPAEARVRANSAMALRLAENVGYFAPGLAPVSGDIGGGMRVAGAAATKGGRARPLEPVRPYSVILFSMVL